MSGSVARWCTFSAAIALTACMTHNGENGAPVADPVQAHQPPSPLGTHDVALSGQIHQSTVKVAAQTFNPDGTMLTIIPYKD